MSASAGKTTGRRAAGESTPRRFRLPKGRRLHLERDFQRVFARRCCVGDKVLAVFVDRNGLEYSRLAVVASRRLGKAVARNRIKRLIREAFRVLQHDLPGGLDIICVPKRTETPSLSAYQAALPRLLDRASRRLATTAPDK